MFATQDPTLIWERLAALHPGEVGRGRPPR